MFKTDFQMWWYLIILLICTEKCTPQIITSETISSEYQIAGIFDSEATVQKKAFIETMTHIRHNEVRFKPIIIEPARADSYTVWKELCSNQEMNPVAIFGPQNPISDGIIRDQSAIVNIPHIQATWQPFDPDLELNTEEEESDDATFKKITINFHPDSDEIASAYGKLLKYYKWENFAVLYEDDFGLMRIQKILAEYTTKYPVTVRKLDPNGDNRAVFKDLLNYQESRIILDCHASRILKYLEDAKELKLAGHYQHYILISMDASTVAKSLTNVLSNVTWLSITDHDQLEDVSHFLFPRVGKWTDASLSDQEAVSDVEFEALIMDDVANHVAQAIDTMEDPPENLCDSETEPWSYGAQLQSRILKTQTTGISGHIEFDKKGRRINYKLYVNEIHVSKRQTIGTWESANDTSIIENRPASANAQHKISKHFIVISKKARPYLDDKVKCDENDETCQEEDADKDYEGFSVDLVKAIFTILRKENLNYTYSFLVEENKSQGTYNPKTKKWNGLLGDLLDNKADLAVCDLTITEERKKFVDFSVPFMTLGISILFVKENKIVPGMFSFLNPYTFDVWMYTATAYCVVSIILFICARISPADWENPEPCEKDPDELENIWNFKNCTWLTMGSIMTQGCDILPKAIGTRWVCGMWWFFAVIVCQTYIAQLSASMTSALDNEPIDSVDDLVKHTKILYGANRGGSTLEFFKGSKYKMYQTIYENMAANDAVLVANNEEGEKRVLNGKNRYAFFMESSTLEYKLKRNCNLKKVGGELDSKDYGIAMPANSPFRSDINRAILHLKESNDLNVIKDKWWDKKYGAKECVEPSKSNEVEGALEMENLIGAFVVLIVGLVLCLFITAAEFMNEVRNIVVREQVTHQEALVKELKSSLNFFQLQKPVLRNPSRAPSVVSSIKMGEKQIKQANDIENLLESEKVVN